jgi:assimilatory nitrate reductase catalytic subunit
MAQMREMAHEILSTEPIVCACFGVTFDAVRHVVSGGGRPTVEDVARELKAGTNCGSCLPELKRMIARERVAHAL